MEFRYTRSYHGPVQAVIADLAGTTVDYGSCAPAGAFVELFANQGVTITQAQAREPMGLHKRDHIAAVAAMAPVSEQWQAKYGAAFSEKDLDRLYEEFVPLQVACLPKYGAVIPGALGAAKELEDMGVSLAVTTGYNREMLEVVLAKAEEQGFEPGVAVCGGDVPRGRPAPWMLYRCLEALGVYPPEAAVAVGDTVPDIEAGLNAGMWSVGVALTGNGMGLQEAELDEMNVDKREARLESARTGLYRAGAHIVVDSFAEMPAVVETINDWLAQGGRP